MGNGLRNAGFLEETTGWTKTTQLTLAVDDTVRGAPGRHVLTGAGTTTTTNQVQAIRTATANRVAVTAGQIVEAFAGFHASHTAVVGIEWYNGAGTLLSTTPLTQRAALLTKHGAGILGLSETFGRGYIRATAPANTASAGIVISVQPAASATAVTLALLKPFLGIVTSLTGEPTLWDPGVHVEEGLVLPAWPSSLRPFVAAPTSELTQTRTEFTGADGISVTRRLHGGPRKKFQGRTRCDAVQRAVLDAFFKAAHPEFWIVDPETEELCIGRWLAEGAPRAAEVRGVTMMVEVGLQLEVA